MPNNHEFNLTFSNSNRTKVNLDVKLLQKDAPPYQKLTSKILSI